MNAPMNIRLPSMDLAELPHDHDAEAALLGSAILDRQAWVESCPVIERSAFFGVDNQLVWDAIATMHGRGQPVDAVTLRDELSKRGTLGDVGGVAKLAVLLGTVPTSAHALHYAGIVAEHARKRALISLGHDLLRQASRPTDVADPSTDIIASAAATLARLAQGGRRHQANRLGEMLDDARQAMAAGPGQKVTLGFRALDDIGGGGLEAGELLLIGARPSMGKSTLARQIWIRAAKAGVPAVLFSLEEGKRKIARNVLSAECRIENKRLRSGSLGEEEWRTLDAGISVLRDLPAFEVETCRRVPDIYAEASRLIAKEGVRLILIDYLQRINAPGKSAYERASAVSLGVSDMVKELSVAAVVPTQLNRGTEQRDDKRPGMGDLRDSGQIEQDADAIVFLHREDYYHITDPNYQPTGEAEVIIGKWRDSERGETVRLKSELRFQTFGDLGGATGDEFDHAGYHDTTRPARGGGVAVDDLP